MHTQEKIREFSSPQNISFCASAGNVGVGEREARIASELVAQRHFRYAIQGFIQDFLLGGVGGELR